MSTAPAISSTSIYTEVEKKDSYNTLDDILKSSCSCKKLHTVIKDMLNVIAEITIDLRTSIVTVEGVCNTFGDSQLSVDVSLPFIICMHSFDCDLPCIVMHVGNSR